MKTSTALGLALVVALVALGSPIAQASLPEPAASRLSPSLPSLLDEDLDLVSHDGPFPLEVASPPCLCLFKLIPLPEEASDASSIESGGSETRVRAFELSPLSCLGGSSGVSLEMPWSCEEFCGQLALGHFIWLTEDPLGDADSQNLYAFVAWQPTTYRDPLGLELGDWWDPRSYASMLDPVKKFFSEPGKKAQQNLNNAGQAWDRGQAAAIGVQVQVCRKREQAVLAVWLTKRTKPSEQAQRT